VKSEEAKVELEHISKVVITKSNLKTRRVSKDITKKLMSKGKNLINIDFKIREGRNKLEMKTSFTEYLASDFVDSPFVHINKNCDIKIEEMYKGKHKKKKCKQEESLTGW
jgi:hypothetical protein